MANIKPGRKSVTAWFSDDDVAVLKRYINECNQEKGRTSKVTVKDALQMILIKGKIQMESDQRHADRMKARRVLGHKWCKHTMLCGGILTAPGEQAQRSHLARDHSDFYHPSMSSADVAGHFKDMTDED